MTEGFLCRPFVLCVLDGWGISGSTDADNAIFHARTPNWDRFQADCPHSTLDASAGDVGLPDGQMGNSEVGHMNIGAGRVVLQDLPRINRAVADGSLAAAPKLRAFAETVAAAAGTCHLLGLMSPGGVHSHQDHIAALARALAADGVAVAVHALLDGRDTPPQSALDYLERFEQAIADAPAVRIATVAGRYYGMDRDRRWPRNQKAYEAMVAGHGTGASSAAEAVRRSYADGVSDEFMVPAVIGGYAGMADGDGLLMANFRADRARQILTALVDPGFDGFARDRRPRFSACLGMVDYSGALSDFMDTLFPAPEIDQTLGEAVAGAGLTQLRVAETEKYAHVTFFLNGGREREFAGEARVLIPSPQVATYDLAPEMAAREVADAVVEALDNRRADLIVVNFANTDMVGHTGDLDAARAAVETVDTCLGRIADAVTGAGGALLITADHGNAEQMRDRSTGAPHTAHTSNPVPLVLVGGPDVTLAPGRLADIAPTVLHLMGLAAPAAMTGKVLAAARTDRRRAQA